MLGTEMLVRKELGLVILLCAVGALGSAARAQSFRTPDGRAAPVLERIESVDGLVALAVRPDGLEAIGAFAIEGRDEHTTLRRFVAAESGAEETVVPGQIRDCIYAPDGMTVYGIVYRPARKRVGDASLFLLDPATLKSRTANRLPPTARDLDLWRARSALLVAATGEVRSIFLDGLRSGSLFRITGNNRAVASLGDAATVLVGQDDALVLVDLDASPGPDAMPELERTPTAQPVSALVIAADGRTGLARMSDGSLAAIGFGPLRLEPAGSGVPVSVSAPALQGAAPVATPKPPAPEPPVPAPTPPPDAASPPPSGVAAVAAGAEAAPAEAGLPDPKAATSPAPQTPTSQGAPVAAPPTSQGQLDAAALSHTASTPAQPEPPPALVPASAPATFDIPGPDARAWGRLTGAEAASVREVVLFGPDNMLSEASRVTPHGGIWEATDLEPGRYRVQVDAGGDRVLVSRPGFLLIAVPPNGSVQAGDCEVVSVIQPEGRR